MNKPLRFTIVAVTAIVWLLVARDLLVRHAINEKFEELTFTWDLVCESIEKDGIDGIPLGHQTRWDSLNIYTANSDHEFGSKPRLLPGKWMQRPCNTKAVVEAIDHRRRGLGARRRHG